MAIATEAGPDDGEMEIRKLASGVYLHTSYAALPNIGFYPSNGLVVVRDQQAYLIDTPWLVPDTGELLRWVEAQGWELQASISTHYHEDRASGIATLNERDIPTWAFAMTNEFLQAGGSATAAHTFDGEGVWLLQDEIYAWYPGGGHTADNIVVWLPREKILVGGCLVRAADARSMGNTADADIAAWAGSALRVQEKFHEAVTVLPGHGAPGGLELLTHTADLAIEIGSDNPNE
ncbi:subclass B1 metallo-beta-lactamase [Halioglobus maricola]|uniref:beta-lactamase n=1 Tax=Halioglobus maricola TaxID=2601894 RepID=A0A5P9NMI9_9GAMM|nr:subclass B1 metallo-beta-lactamase [Halioglobus maricola]QFU77050.1 subclass B1 metallo-beta-lactamase [Halioglobus maricola]